MAATEQIRLARAQKFAERLNIRLPILLAPMAGSCPPSLSIEVAGAGGLGACGALLLKPEEIAAWSREFRSRSKGEFQINLWIPGPAPVRDIQIEKEQREFLERWGPAIPPTAGDSKPPDFQAQCEAMLDAAPKAISSIMGLYPPDFVAAMKARGIYWLATVTNVEEARAAEKAGADAVVAQGMEAGGHRGTFDAEAAEEQMVGLMALVPQVADAVRIPVIAAGGIADGRGIAAALILGASAVQIGTGLLRSPEAMTPAPFAERLGRTEAHQTRITRAFSGRAGRSIATEFVRAASRGPKPAPYPVQRGLASALRESARQAGDIERMQAWAGQSAKLAKAEPAAQIIRELWKDARSLLFGNTVTPDSE